MDKKYVLRLFRMEGTPFENYYDEDLLTVWRSSAEKQKATRYTLETALKIVKHWTDKDSVLGGFTLVENVEVVNLKTGKIHNPL